MVFQDSKVWVPDVDYVWKCAVLSEDFKGQKSLRVVYEDDGEVSKLKIDSYVMIMYIRETLFFTSP